MYKLEILLFWLPFIAAHAIAQGLCMPAIKRTVPGKEASLQAFALHYLLVFAYFWPVIKEPHWLEIFCAVAVRFSLFDFLLNYTEKLPLFSVGKTAISDRFQRWLALRLKQPVRHINAGSKVLGILALIAVFAFTRLVL